MIRSLDSKLFQDSIQVAPQVYLNPAGTPESAYTQTKSTNNTLTDILDNIKSLDTTTLYMIGGGLVLLLLLLR